MAHSKVNFLLAVLLLSTAGPAAGASVMRVNSGGDVEMLQTESVSGLVNMFSDDPEAQAVTAKLLAEGKPSDDLLPFVQKLKEQILPWHKNSEATLKAAIADIESCKGSMDNGMLGTKPKKDVCSAKSTEHKAHRKDESTKFETKEHWKVQEVEKKEIMTTECKIFEKAEDEAKKASASYSGGDEEAYLERTAATFCEDLLPRYEDAKQKCTTGKAEHVQVSETYESKKTAWTVQETASDGVQTEMDETCCEYAMATKDVCTALDTCYEDKVQAYKAVEAIIKGEEKVKKTEWRVYSRIECLLPVLGTENAKAIETCREKTHDTSHLDIDYPEIPGIADCEPDEAFPGSDAYYTAHVGDLPDNAKGKKVAKCTGMMGGVRKQAAVETNQDVVAETYKCGDAKTEMYSAYWEYGTCGHFGNDYNNKMCGGYTIGKCPEVWTNNGEPIVFPAEARAKYPTETAAENCCEANLVSMVKSRAYKKWEAEKVHDVNLALKLKKCDANCGYLWHAQYKCVKRCA